MLVINGVIANKLSDTNVYSFAYPVFNSTPCSELRFWKENSYFICKSNKAVFLYDSVEEMITVLSLSYYPYFHKNQSVHLLLGYVRLFFFW
jgi:hypothetical protein